MSGNNNNNTNLRAYLEKLNYSNFVDWERNLRIVLRAEGREDVLDTPIPALNIHATEAEQLARKAIEDKSVFVTCLMLASMESNLQKRFDGMDAYSIIQQLKQLFQRQARIERYETHRELLECKQSDSEPVGGHVLKMMDLFQKMSKLGLCYTKELATDIILISLHDDFKSFRMNFNMQNRECTLEELHGMLVTAEQDIPLKPKKEILMVKKGKGFKNVGKGKKNIIKGKGKNIVQTNDAPKKQKIGKPPKEGKCFYCEGPGHWKCNWPKYLEDKKNGASSSGIYVIEINLATTNSWVFDTGCGSHIISNVQGLRKSRRLAKGEVDLRVGNGAKVAALAVGTYSLSLPSGLVLELNNCYFVPAITKNIISVSVLDSEGF